MKSFQNFLGQRESELRQLAEQDESVIFRHELSQLYACTFCYRSRQKEAGKVISWKGNSTVYGLVRDSFLCMDVYYLRDCLHIEITERFILHQSSLFSFFCFTLCRSSGIHLKYDVWLNCSITSDELIFRLQSSAFEWAWFHTIDNLITRQRTIWWPCHIELYEFTCSPTERELTCLCSYYCPYIVLSSL